MRASSTFKTSRRQHTASVSKYPIALKFAFFITLLVLVFMTVVTVLSVRQVEILQEKEVNENGVRSICMLTAAIDPTWLIDSSQRQKLEDLLSEIMRETEGLGIRNAMVRDSPRSLVATGLRERLVYRSEQEKPVESEVAAASNVEVIEFVYEGEPIRSFRRAILRITEGKTEEVGQAEILVSATQIQRARDDQRKAMFALSALICAIAAAGSFLLAAVFAHPIRTLVKDLRQVSLGNLEHRSKIRSRDELGDLARTFNQMTANLRQAQEVLLARKAAEQEMELAAQIQQRLLPSSTPEIPGFEVSAYYQPAQEVGGDYYDFLRIDEERIGMVVADVSGKGVPGSLVMTMTRSLLRLAAKGVTSPKVAVSQVNRVLSPDMTPGMFVTLLYFVLHLPNRQVALVRAGHNGPIYFDTATNTVQYLQPAGMAIGLDRTGQLFGSELQEFKLTLKSGDFLMAYTDGVVEAKNAAGQDYTEQRLADLLRKNCQSQPQELISEVIADVKAHRGNAEPSDDITLLALKRKM